MVKEKEPQILNVMVCLAQCSDFLKDDQYNIGHGLLCIILGKRDFIRVFSKCTRMAIIIIIGENKKIQ